MAKPHYPRRPRPKSRAEFVAREQQVWGELTSTWQGLPDDAFLRPGACGPTWSIKDVMNHVAAWQEFTIQSLPAIVAGNHIPYPGVDRFNAVHQKQDIDIPLEDTLRRFDATRKTLLELIATLPENRLLDPDSDIGYWVKYATYGHYSGHIYDLLEFRRLYQAENPAKASPKLPSTT
jgi:hypothetical protein